MDISIIGAGAVGNYTAYLFAKKGFNTRVFDKRENIGSKESRLVVSDEIMNIIGVTKECVLNKTEKVRAYSPDGNHVEFKSRYLLLDRAKFERYIADEAQVAGAKISRQHELIDYKKNELIFQNLKHHIKKKVKANLIVGADGVDSKVAELSGLHLPKNRRFLYSEEAVVSFSTDRDTLKVYFENGKETLYKWIMPAKKKHAVVGVISNKENNDSLYKFFQKLKIKPEDVKAIHKTRIPLHDREQILRKRNFYLVGDAALHAKATTGTGLIQGFKAAQALVYSVMNKTDYHKELGYWVSKDLALHLELRKILGKMKHKEINNIVRLLGNDRIRKLLSKESSENPSKLLIKLFINEPRLLFYSKGLLKKLIK